MTPEVITILILDIVFILFATIAFILSLKITLYYDKEATTDRQYRLEKHSYLGATIIKYIFALKIPLFIFFIFTLDKISIILPGAMCAAGVVNATDYGLYLFIFKLLNLYLFALWIVLNAEDMKSEEQRYVKTKFQLFLPLYFFLVIEIILEALMFLSIDIKDVVDCCGVIFSSSDSTYMAQIIGAPAILQSTLFYLNFLLLFIAYVMKQKYLFSIFNALFALISITTLIGFFGTYIYEMPTHHCPFCFLQSDYHYVGYLLYALLFGGTFLGIVIGLIPFSKKEEKKYYNLSLLLNASYLLLVSSYVLIYYQKNSVWL